MRARGCLALCVGPGLRGAVCVALVGVLRRTDLKPGERRCGCLGFCRAAEAAAGGGDVESPEADVHVPVHAEGKEIFSPLFLMLAGRWR